MISYINTSPLVFYLSADNIISLQQQGLPLPVINAMINRYGQSQRQNSMMAGAGQTQQPQYAAPQVQVPAQAPPPQYYSYDSRKRRLLPRSQFTRLMTLTITIRSIMITTPVIGVGR